MIKIEVTGNSIPEVADKLIAIGHSLRNTAINDAYNVAREAMQTKRDAKLEATMPELREEIFEPTVGNAPSEAASSGATEASPTAPSGPEPEAPNTGEPLNFELDVARVVLRAVATKGKPFVQGVLAEFGGARASDLNDNLWPELIARLEAEMA